MAPICVPCPKVALVSGVGSKLNAQVQRISASSVSFGSSFNGLQSLKSGTKFHVKKVQAQVNEVVAEKSENNAPVADLEPLKEEEESAGNRTPDAESISAFMTQVSDLVKLVDSRDIMELQLKQLDCELVIRKKEALQPSPAAPSAATPPSYSPAMFAPPPPPAPAAAPAASAPAPAAAAAPAPPPAAKENTSSLPTLKSPMAGTFYRCPAPGAPPFVKVGDKVEKGQVLCIVEAMKLMNEIEAEQSGTIKEILVDDGKPVSMGLPLFAIAP